MRRPTGELASLPYKVEALQDQTREQRSFNKQLLDTLAEIHLALQSLDLRLKVHDESRNFYRAIAIGLAVLIGGAVFTAAIALMRGRIPPP